MSDDKVYPVTSEWRKKAHIDASQYRDLYQESIQSPESFWPKIGNLCHLVQAMA